MADDRPTTPYEQRLARAVRGRAERRHARKSALQRAFAKGRAMSVIDAIHMAWESIFGGDCVGPRSVADRRVLTAGEAHRGYDEVSRRDARREAQLQRIRDFLDEWNVVKTEGNLQCVLRVSLRKALRAAGFPDISEAHSLGGSAASAQTASPEPAAANAIKSSGGPPAPIVPWAALPAASSDAIATKAGESPASPPGPEPDPTQDAVRLRRQRKRNPEAEAKWKNDIESVIAAAKTKWRDAAKRPSEREMAKELTKPPNKYPFSNGTVRQILLGTYPPMKKRQMAGLSGR